MSRRPLHPANSPRRGVVLIGLLLMLLVLGLLAERGAEVWATTVRREAEMQLLFVGEQYRQAIRRYYFAAPPGQARVLPASLEELLDDRRSLVPAQHLRRLYPDPVSPDGEWGLVMQGNRISGVHSLSEDKPIKQSGFAPALSVFEGRATYREWMFVFTPPATRRR